jgi:hypothetical protein
LTSLVRSISVAPCISAPPDSCHPPSSSPTFLSVDFASRKARAPHAFKTLNPPAFCRMICTLEYLSLPADNRLPFFQLPCHNESLALQSKQSVDETRSSSLIMRTTTSGTERFISSCRFRHDYCKPKFSIRDFRNVKIRGCKKNR